MIETIYPWNLQREMVEQIKIALDENPCLYPYTEQYVWGKEVRIPRPNIEDSFVGTIENWYVQYVLDSTKESLLDDIKWIAKKCRIQEVEKVGKMSHPLICQLCEWRPLEDEQGKIIRRSPSGEYSITMVKYALVVDKSLTEQWKDEKEN